MKISRIDMEDDFDEIYHDGKKESLRTADFNLKFQNMKDSESRYESNSAGRICHNNV
jgi:hypothetical protein